MTGWVRFFHDLHGTSFITGGLGRELVGWLGVAHAGAGLLRPRAVVAARPAQWKAAFTVRRTARGLRLNRELHGAIGIWSLVIFMVVNFTGVYLAFPQQISGAVNAIWPGRDMRAAMFQARVEPVRGADADRLRRGASRSPGAPARCALPQRLPADPARARPCASA